MDVLASAFGRLNVVIPASLSTSLRFTSFDLEFANLRAFRLILEAKTGRIVVTPLLCCVVSVGSRTLVSSDFTSVYPYFRGNVSRGYGRTFVVTGSLWGWLVIAHHQAPPTPCSLLLLPGTRGRLVIAHHHTLGPTCHQMLSVHF